MGIAEILASLDLEIATLEKARRLIATATGARRKRGRPSKASSAVSALIGVPAKKRKKNNLSAEGRKKIADAQKRRWAAKRKAGANGD